MEAPSQAMEGGPESPVFMPTPRNIESAFEILRQRPGSQEFKERIADMDSERIASLMQSVEGQEELVDILMNQQDTLVEADPNLRVDPENLQSQVQLVGASLRDMQDYDTLIREAEETVEAEAEEDQERIGLFRRALRGVKGFAKRHPVVASILVVGLTAAAVAGSVALGYYLTGNWAALMTKVGLSAENTALEVGGAMDAMEPVVENLPGAGAYSTPAESPFGNM